MGVETKPIQIQDNTVNCPIVLQGAISRSIQMADNTLNCPIILGFPEAPTLSEFEFDLDSPMA